MDRASDGVPHNPSTQSGGNGQTEQKTNKVLTLLQLCSKAITKLSRVNLYKSPKGLRSLREEVKKLITKVTAKISSLEIEARNGDDLDQFACQDEIDRLTAKLASLEAGPALILKHSAQLRKEAEKDQQTNNQTDQGSDQS